MSRSSKLATLLLAGSIACFGHAALAASHREAPLIAHDPAAGNTDVYAFVSYDADNLARPPEDRRVTFIMNYNPGQDPVTGRTISISAMRFSIGSTSTTTRMARRTTSPMNFVSRRRTARSAAPAGSPHRCPS